MDEILKAIEAQNKAFADFKEANERRIKALETNPARAAEIQEEMKGAFAKMDEYKATIEKLEAKMTNRLANGAGDDTKTPQAVADEEHRKGFVQYMRKGVETGLRALESKSTLNTVNVQDGGYAVPRQIDADIENLEVDMGVIRQLARVIQVSTPDYHKLVNLHGMASGWVGEIAARPPTDTPTIADIVPPMGELYANPQVTQVALEDMSFDVEAWLAAELAETFGVAEDVAFCNGNGTNKPRGFLQNTIVATADATRALGSIQYVPTGAAANWATTSATVNQTDALFALVGSLKQAYRANAKIVTSKNILFAIAAMKDVQGRYIFNPTSAPGMPQQVLNYPIYEDENMPAMGANAYSLAIADWRRAYLIVDRVGLSTLRDPYTNKPYVGFYSRKRVGGAVVNSEAIKVLKFAAS